MPRGVAFDDLLQEKIGAQSIDSTPAVTLGPPGMAAAYGFFFVEAPRTAGAGLTAAMPAFLRGQSHAMPLSASRPDVRFAGAVEAPSARQYAPVPPRGQDSKPARRIVRTLSARERAALDELVALGGNLTADFTFGELRSTFRALARRYHPDRHAGCGDDERRRLAQLFTRTRDAYRVLLDAHTR